MNWPTKKPDPKFIEWCKETYDSTEDQILSSDDIDNRHPSNNTQRLKFENEFLGKIIEKVENKNKFNVIINTELKSPYLELSLKKLDLENYINIFQFSGGNICLDGLNILRLLITGGGYLKHISLFNCNIKEIEIGSGGKNPPKSNVDLHSTNIGHFILAPNCLVDLKIEKGVILNITCPPTHQENPFVGSVSFKDVDFQNKPLEGFLRGAQPYRNLRYHLRSMENSLAANIIHSVELTTEREEDTTDNKFFGFLYQIISNYGASTSRPLIWLIGTFVLSFIIIYFSDGAVPLTDKSLYVGWRSTLLCDGFRGEMAKSVLLSLQSSFNPLSIFGTKSFLIPKNFWIAALTAVQGVFSAIFIAFFIFALRRRFKINQ